MLPIFIKDVAGLVPGAYRGHGKGNKFLNDLCDADVLLHVVDVSGLSDSNGNILTEREGETGDASGNGNGDAGNGDAASAKAKAKAKAKADAESGTAEKDICWLREELHRWVVGNVVSKWRSVARSPAPAERLQALVTGYQGHTASLAAAACARAGLDAAAAHLWGLSDVHLFVAYFLSVRFPMALALNKSDKADAARIERAAAAAQRSGYRAVPCSAMAEAALQRAARRGELAYRVAGAEFRRLRAPDPASEEEVAEQAGIAAAAAVLRRFGSTGCADAVSEAVALAEPLLLYPVLRDVRTVAPAALGCCVQALPGSSVEDVFEALKRGVAGVPFRLDGDFIRAEVTGRAEVGGVGQQGAGVEQQGAGRGPGSRQMRMLGKDAALSPRTSVLRILTNRKVAWQEKAHAQAIALANGASH